MYRRRSRNRGLWFPTNTGGTWTRVNGPAGPSAVILDVSDVLATSAAEPVNVTNWGAFSLADALGQGYLVKRIVGQVHVGVPNAEIAALGFDPARQNIVLAGVFVDRVDTTGAPQNLDAWNPFIEASSQKRWLWRREWNLTNPNGNAYVDNVAFLDFPLSNAEYGSVREGTVVDIKVKARVTYEERLFFLVAVASPSSSTTQVMEVFYRHNLRMFATPLPRGNR